MARAFLAGLLVAGALVAGLTACAAASPGDARVERSLRGQAADVAREIAGLADERGLDDPADAIQEYARRAVPLLATTGVSAEAERLLDRGSPDSATELRLVGVEASATELWEEPVGALVVAAEVTEVDGGEARSRDLCLRLELDRWGPVGGWDDDARIAPVVPCPAVLDTVVPESDARAIVVVPENAEAVATDVLANAGDAAADALAAAITAGLATPTGEREVAAEVQVARDGARIGFAMGTPEDCLLLRAADGAVERLHVSSVQLQPGELGCSASTALASDDALRPPH